MWSSLGSCYANDAVFSWVLPAWTLLHLDSPHWQLRCLLRASGASFPFKPTMHIALIGCLFLLATARISLFALTPLPAVLYFVRRSRAFLISSAALICLTAGWIIYALVAVKGLPPRELTTAELIKHYLFSPYSLLRILINTFTNTSMLARYWHTFISILFWLDAWPLGVLYQLCDFIRRIGCPVDRAQSVFDPAVCERIAAWRSCMRHGGHVFYLPCDILSLSDKRDRRDSGKVLHHDCHRCFLCRIRKASVPV